MYQHIFATCIIKFARGKIKFFKSKLICKHYYTHINQMKNILIIIYNMKFKKNIRYVN